MGLINSLYKPEYWIINKKGLSKVCLGDIIYEMIVGEFEDEVSQGDITIFISKVNYEKILNNEYRIKTYPYSETPVKLLDNNNKQIPLVMNHQIEAEKEI